jgi:glycine/D-amino acid oxidase-like deaminating enzyme/nitrite reductase/ring-hydroxylating ferredoxin subunit
MERMEPRNASVPLFADTVPPVAIPSLAGEPKQGLSADVVVIGAGIAGLTTAYLLARAGRSVIVLDSIGVGAGMTGRTTAHLSCAIDDRYAVLIRRRGVDDARLAAESHAGAIDRIEQIARNEGIDCDFARVDGYLFPFADDLETIDKELEAAHRAGLTQVERLGLPPVAALGGPCLRFPNQGRFHAMKYLAGLVRCLQRDGARLFGKARVVGVEDGEVVRIETASGHRIEGGRAVVATNTPFNDRFALHTKQAPYRTYAIAAEVPAGTVPDALYWDTGDPYHYVRLQPIGDRKAHWLIVGGEDHKTGQADDGALRLQRLEEWARTRFPAMAAVRWRWSGQVMETVDFLAFAGRNPGDRNVFVATGDSGMGITHGTIAGIVIAELAQGRSHPWATLYDPGRKTLAAAGDFARENLNVAAQFVDLVTGGDVDSPDQVKPGSGAVIRRGMAKRAVYRDEHGGVHERSAVCPHLGCIVAWNSFERGWDCPCHGSLYAADGTVLNGPSPVSLKD